MKPEELPNPDDVLKRMLNTPPKPHQAKKDKPDKKEGPFDPSRLDKQ